MNKECILGINSSPRQRCKKFNLGRRNNNWRSFAWRNRGDNKRSKSRKIKKFC